jgi:hypothetical protein
MIWKLFQTRLMALEPKAAKEILILTEDQVRALQRARAKAVFAKLYVRKNALVAAGMLNHRMLPF